ncbi:MAG: iron ABC transporter permease [Halioglobus sp.]
MEVTVAGTVSKKGFFPVNNWRVALVATATLISIPVLVIVASLLQPYSPAWRHLAETVLGDYVTNSALLMLGVGTGTLILGVTAAWLTAMCEFPGRRFFSWALLLPMAIPAYIIAYTYTGLLDFGGPVQEALRETFDWRYGDYYFPQIRSLGGAICMLSLVLYPYVYLLVRIAFLEQSTAVLEASRSLGKTPWQTFFQVALPMARPAIVAGLSLALMETLADYGTVEYFGVSAFTTGIFRTWYGLGELNTAAQLAAVLLLFVFVLIVLERWSRRRMRFHHQSIQREPSRIHLTGSKAVLAFAVALSIFSLGFLIPAGQLSVWALGSWQGGSEHFLALVVNSFGLAAIASLACLLLALLVGYGKRLHPGPIEESAARISSMGYAVPGTVIAVGVLIPFAWLDNSIDSLARSWFNVSTGLLLSGTLFALVFAYVVRFLSVSLQSVESGLAKIRPSIDESARSLGRSPIGVLRDIHLPMLRGSLLTALLLVFVDVLKELPTTLILRPFNFNTLAVRTYELASDERLAEAALPALAIVAIGLLPVILLTRSMSRETPTAERSANA